MKKKLSRIIFLCMTMLALWLQRTPAGAFGAEVEYYGRISEAGEQKSEVGKPESVTIGRISEPVRVGYYEDGDYMSLNQHGEYVGYNIEYIQELAKQTGLPFEMVDAGSWTAAYGMLAAGEIDVLPSVYYTEERSKEIAFVTQPMCSIYTTLNVRMEDERYNYEDFAAFEGMKVGIIRGGVDGERFKEFCREHEVNLDIIEYDETGALLGALETGVVDGVAITHLGKNSTFRSVAQFAPSPLYLAVAAQDKELLEELNRAMDNILLSNPGYGTDLYDKYLGPSTSQKPVFTKEERQYIGQAGIVTAAFDPSLAPLSWRDEETGEFKGVAADIFEFIAQNSGLEFRFAAYPQSEALELLKAGEIDVLCISDGDYLWDSRNKINSTLYYLSTPTSMITRYDDGNPEVLALPRGFHLSELIADDFSDSRTIYYPSAQACLDAVRRGDADVTYLNTQSAGYLMNQSSYRDLREAALGQYGNKLCIGVAVAADSRLFSVLNKCIRYLPAEQVDAFLVSNSMNSGKISLSEFVRQHIWAVILLVCLVLGVIILLVSHNLKNALRSNRRIQELLYQDDLTGLESMNGFYRKWRQAAENGRNKNIALLYSDIRQFKLINDNFGFAAGDQVLCAYARVLQETLQNGEECARVSADNFVLMMNVVSWDQLVERLKLQRERLDCWRREHTDIPYQIELVFGVYLPEGPEDTDIKQMLDFANYARRSAKDTPGCFAVLYDEQMRRQALLAGELAGGLDHALKQNEFEVFYQPKVSMKDGKITGSEALIRWNHPEMGFLTPGTFIPLFERNGMIRKVDFWLFEAVCRSMHQWSGQGRKLLPVSCNFSRMHFDQEDFPDRVCQVADKWGIPHPLLEIEVTESALIDETGSIQAMLARLKEQGFLIAIDDFGSGYSSLGQLQKLPADVIKLDRSFVSDDVTGGSGKIVVENVIHMAGELGMSVICEGVESLIQSEVLQKMGCRFAQGYYYYKPMRQKDYEMLL